MAYEDRHCSEITGEYYEGMHARRRGISLDENPYTGSIGMRPLRWASGWRDEDEVSHGDELCPICDNQAYTPGTECKCCRITSQSR